MIAKGKIQFNDDYGSKIRVNRQCLNYNDGSFSLKIKVLNRKPANGRIIHICQQKFVNCFR